MAFEDALLSFLNNPEEPLKKRLKLLDNTFQSAEVPLEQKEAFLFKWILKFSTKNDSDQKEMFELLVKWIHSEQFKELSRNDICSNDIEYIINVLTKKLQAVGLVSCVADQIQKVAFSILANKVFQDYFKQNSEKYCKFLKSVMLQTETAAHLQDILKKPWVFGREHTLQDKFFKYFLDIILPVFVQKLIHFKNEELSVEMIKTLQKCLFSDRSLLFETYFCQFFEETALDSSVNQKMTNLPKTILKHLCASYEENSEELRTNFKLIFHSFCILNQANTSLIYKLIIIVLQRVGFDLSNTFDLKKSNKPKFEISLQKSLEVYDTLLEVLHENNTSIDAKVQEIAFIDFLRNMVKSLVNFNVPCSKVYEIILKTIKINPLVIEPIVGQVISFIMLANNKNQDVTYQKLVISIMEVFAKLHRIQNFVSTIIPELKKSLQGQINSTEIYRFEGELDKIILEKKDLLAVEMFTEDILQYLTKCICDLASWQVINLFKTLLFHLKEAVAEFAIGGDNQETVKFVFLEILGIFTCRLLQSSKTADHTITTTTVEKFVRCLDELKGILQNFGNSILKKEHNPTTMRTFLGMCYNWAEIYMTLAFYCFNEEVKITRTLDNTYSACNLMYLHSYLDVKQWQLISQRITNFGEYPCKRILQKLFVQKIKALMLFETNFNDDILTNVVKQIQDLMDETWKDLLIDKFVIRHLFLKMDDKSKLFLAENLLKDDKLCGLPEVVNSVEFVNILVYTIMSKITKIINKQNKKNQAKHEVLSIEVFNKIPKEFYQGEAFDSKDIIHDLSEKFWVNEGNCTLVTNEDKIEKCLKLLKKFPFIYSSEEIQRTVFLYLFLLHTDLLNNTTLKNLCEDLIIGILQSTKFCVSDIMDLDKLFLKILQNFDKYEQVFSLVLSNVLKKDENFKELDFCVDCLLKNSEEPKYLKSSVMIFKCLNKGTKSKSALDINETKDKILNRITKHLLKTDCCVETYAVCLKQYLATNDSSDNLKKLLKKLPNYIQLSLNNEVTSKNVVGSLLLLLTILHNKQKVETKEEDFVLRVWKWLKNIGVQFSDLEEYSQLVRLVVTLIPNEKFGEMVDDLLKLTVHSINTNDDCILIKQLKIWESVLTCNINPTKMNILQQSVENLVQNLLKLIQNNEFNKELFKSVVLFKECAIQTHHFILSSNLIDSLLLTPTILVTTHSNHFEDTYSFSMAILEKLLSHRNALIMDRLPAFLQQYRALLKPLCDRSNSELNLEPPAINKMADLAHRLEKLTKNLVACKKDMSRIALYLVADILERYEQINLYPSVKLHLNNCIYSLISLFDHHAVAYLMRVLSSASTEMFKIMYEHYKKYYMFTGKV